MGEIPEQRGYGPPLHSFLAKQWSNILQKSLPKETKTELLKKYPTPSNCSLLSAPILNAEAKAILGTSAIRKDGFQKTAQEQIASVLNALGLALSEVMLGKKNEAGALIVDINRMVNLMGDAGRLCAEYYFCASRTRKYFVAQGTNLSRTAKTLIGHSERDNFLLGNDFGENLKAAKASEKPGKEMLTSDSPKQHKFKGH